MNYEAQLKELIDGIRSDREQLERDREALARAFEQLTESERVKLAVQVERDRVCQLIDAQLDQLYRGSFDSCLLRALKRQVMEVTP